MIHSMNLARAFTEHPAAVGETYGQHLRQACGFSARMLVGAAACFVHALLPFMFERTGSATVQQLHTKLSARRVCD